MPRRPLLELRWRHPPPDRCGKAWVLCIDTTAARQPQASCPVLYHGDAGATRLQENKIRMVSPEWTNMC